MLSLDAFVSGKLRALEKENLLRHLVVTDRYDCVHVRRNGRDLISFCCNDYLNMSHNPAVINAAKDAVQRYGTGAGASRLVTGNHPLFSALEERLAALKQSEDCVVFGSGYLANLGIIPSLVGAPDLVLADELSHACLLSGARLSSAKTYFFRHNDMQHLRHLLEMHRTKARHCLVLTDGVFSMDGDLAPVADMHEITTACDAWLMTDDAHGIGVTGEGRGSNFIQGHKVDVPLQMGTLSKALGSFGGYLCASRPVTDYIRTRARTLVYSTGLSPANVAAAIASLDYIKANPAYAKKPLEKARRFSRALALPEAQSPVVPLILGSAGNALAASRLLEKEGFLVTAIRPPTVPAGTGRLRFTFTAGHDDADIDRLAVLVKEKILVTTENI